MAVKQLSHGDYTETVKFEKKPVLLDFYADWCGPCKMLAPVLDNVAAEYKDSYNFYRVDVDREPELATEFGISVIPTLVRLNNGKVVEKSTGYLTKKDLLAFLNLN